MAQSDQGYRAFNQATGDLSQAGSEQEPLVLSGMVDPSQRYQTLQLPDGSMVQVETGLLLRQPGTTGDAAGSFTGTRATEARTTGTQTAGNDGGQAGLVIPLVEETLEVGKRTVTTGMVRLLKTVQEYEQTLNEPLAVRTYDVERVVRNETVESAPPVRHEGETTIYPLVEERLILTKQLILREEIRVTKRDTERLDTQVVKLRREHIEVERSGADGKG